VTETAALVRQSLAQQTEMLGEYEQLKRNELRLNRFGIPKSAVF
jgi:hypothetical protein